MLNGFYQFHLSLSICWTCILFNYVSSLLQLMMMMSIPLMRISFSFHSSVSLWHRECAQNQRNNEIDEVGILQISKRKSCTKISWYVKNTEIRKNGPQGCVHCSWWVARGWPFFSIILYAFSDVDWFRRNVFPDLVLSSKSVKPCSRRWTISSAGGPFRQSRDS